MQIKKEECAGGLYLGYMYSAGIIPKSSPRARAARKSVTSEGKTLVNHMRRKFALMLLIGANFEAGRDLFIYLGFEQEPNEQEDRKAMRAFHRAMGRLYETLGIEYKYVDARETHARDGEPCRLHHHIIVSGTGRQMLGRIAACWGRGSVDVRVLREFSDNFEDTCAYILKERKDRGKRAYSTSQNMRRPPDPLRRRLPDGAVLEIPDGVKVSVQRMRDNEFGRYEIMVGKIVDKRAFDSYWQRVQRDRRKLDEREYWRSRATKTARRLAAGEPEPWNRRAAHAR